MRTLKLRLREPFTTAQGTFKAKQNVLLQIAGKDGDANGEGSPRRGHRQGLRQCRASLQRWLSSAHLPEVLSSSTPGALLSSFSGPTAARSALDMVLHDLWACEQGITVTTALAELYRLRPMPVPRTSYTIGIDTTERMIAKTIEAREYPILKVKLGTDRDMEILEAVRSVSDAEIRVDVNGAWTERETRLKAPRLLDLGVSVLEQPLHKENLIGYRNLFGSLPMPVIADESCCTLHDVERLEGAADGINIKLSKVGGLCVAAQMIRAARAKGMLVMVGCFVESSLAITAAGALAPYADFLDLDGAKFLSRDPFQGARIPKGELVMPEGPGLGVRPTSVPARLSPFRLRG